MTALDTTSKSSPEPYTKYSVYTKSMGRVDIHFLCSHCFFVFLSAKVQDRAYPYLNFIKKFIHKRMSAGTNRMERSDQSDIKYLIRSTAT